MRKGNSISDFSAVQPEDVDRFDDPFSKVAPTDCESHSLLEKYNSSDADAAAAEWLVVPSEPICLCSCAGCSAQWRWSMEEAGPIGEHSCHCSPIIYPCQSRHLSRATLATINMPICRVLANGL